MPVAAQWIYVRAVSLAALSLACVPLSAQVDLRGRVVDENNAPVASAEIVLRCGTTALRATSAATGEFALETPAADCALRVSAAGFFDLRDAEFSTTAAPPGITLVLNHIRDSLQSVDVTGVTTPLDAGNTTPEQRLTGAELLAIPYRSDNNIRSALRILPGVVEDAGGGIHINGGEEDQALYLLDGFNVTDPVTGHFESRLAVESVQALTVQSGATPAEFGKGSAGVLSVNTKMGNDKFRYGATNFVPGVEYRKEFLIGSWTPRVYVSGPIARGRAWFFDSLTAQYAKDVVADLPRGQDQTSSWRYGNLLRTQFNITPSNILFAGLLTNVFNAGHSGLSALNPPETTVNLHTFQQFFDVKDQIYFGHGSLAEFGFAMNRTTDAEHPQGHDFYILTPFGDRGNYFVDGERRGSRDQLLANYFLPSFTWHGTHQLKTGADADRVFYWQDLSRTGFINYNAASRPVRKVVFEGNGRLDLDNFETSAYVEDSWRTRSNLLLELGLRWDWDQVLHNWNTSPRAGFAWAPFGRESIKVSGGYGLIYDATSLPLFARPFDQYPVSTLYVGGVTPFSSVSSFVLGKRHFETPRAHNLNLGISEQLPAGLFVSVNGIMRRGFHGLSFFDTTGLAPETIYRLLDSRRDSYRAVEISVRQNLRKQYEWTAAYTRSRASSNAVLDLNADQPLFVTNNLGRLPWDAPNRFLSWGLLPTPLKKWSFAWLLDTRSGYPWTVRDEAGRVVGGVNQRRFPIYFELDVAVEREFAFRKQRWAWRMGLENITARRNYEFVNNDIDSPHFGEFYGGLGRGASIRVRWLGAL